jgi:hypothetical protein
MREFACVNDRSTAALAADDLAISPLNRLPACVCIATFHIILLVDLRFPIARVGGGSARSFFNHRAAGSAPSRLLLSGTSYCCNGEATAQRIQKYELVVELAFCVI